MTNTNMIKKLRAYVDAGCREYVLTEAELAALLAEIGALENTDARIADAYARGYRHGWDAEHAVPSPSGGAPQ